MVGKDSEETDKQSNVNDDSTVTTVQGNNNRTFTDPCDKCISAEDGTDSGRK